MFFASPVFWLIGNEANSLYKTNFLCGVIDKSPKTKHLRSHDTYCVLEISLYFA